MARKRVEHAHVHILVFVAFETGTLVLGVLSRQQLETKTEEPKEEKPNFFFWCCSALF